MSTFLIDKIEYARAAGVVAGFIKADKETGGEALHLWCEDEQKVYDDVLLVRDFLKCHAINRAASGDEGVSDCDGNDCLLAFKAAKDNAANLWRDPNSEPLKQQFWELSQFLDSALYQCDEPATKPGDLAWMEQLFSAIRLQIVCVLYKEHATESWGELQIVKAKRRYAPMFDGALMMMEIQK